MKYNEKNPPLVCMMTQSTCYKGTKKFTPKGILWHSTGANNPYLKRYVQPDDKAPDREEWLSKLGKNKYSNDWNHAYRKAGMNFWIGKLADGTVAAVQTMPWDYRPWGCGSGSKGSCNDTHIQFEICEDGLNDKKYWDAVYKEACEMTAYLCKMYGIDPLGTIDYKGQKVPTIIDHRGSHALGLGSNHGDVLSWSKRYGVTMETARKDVAAILAEEQLTDATTDQPNNTPTTEPATTDTPVTEETDEQLIWNTLLAAIGNPYGVAGLMGNLKAESNLQANNLQNNGNKTLGMTDAEFTAAFDKGEYDEERFIHDGYGYGLAQWTYHTRKQALLEYAKAAGTSIGDLRMQLGFLVKELKAYTAVWNTLANATSIRAASDKVLVSYERPANQSDAVKEKRAAYGQTFFDRYNQGFATYKVRVTSRVLNHRRGPSTSYDSYGYIKPGTYTVVEETNGWGRLQEFENAWICLKFATKI